MEEELLLSFLFVYVEKKIVTSLVAVGDQESHAGVEICSKTHTHRCGISVRQAPRTYHRKKNATLLESKRNFCSLFNYIISCGHHFIIHLTKYAWRQFFSPLSTHKFFSTLEFSSTESLDVCGNFTHVKKKYLLGKKKI